MLSIKGEVSNKGSIAKANNTPNAPKLKAIKTEYIIEVNKLNITIENKQTEIIFTVVFNFLPFIKLQIAHIFSNSVGTIKINEPPIKINEQTIVKTILNKIAPIICSLLQMLNFFLILFDNNTNINITNERITIKILSHGTSTTNIK